MLGGVEEVPVIQRLMSDLLAVDVCDAAGNDRRKLTMDDFLIVAQVVAQVVAQDLNSTPKNRWFNGCVSRPERPPSVRLGWELSFRSARNVPSKG